MLFKDEGLDKFWVERGLYGNSRCPQYDSLVNFYWVTTTPISDGLKQ